MGYNLNDRLQYLEEKEKIKENKNKIVTSQREEKEKQKNFKKQLFLKARMILFDTMQDRIKNDYIMQDKLYKTKTKEKIIDKTLSRMQKVYKLTENTQEELNYYLYINYYTTASKVIAVVKKEQKALIQEQNIKNAKKTIEEAEKIQEQENAKKEKEEKEEKEQKTIDIILTILFLIFWIWILSILF
jgi:hypothetical protein